MKQTLVIAILLLPSFRLIAGGGSPTTSNEYVKYQVALKEKSIKPSGRGTLLIMLQPKHGVHINLKPPITITFDSTNVVAGAGSPAIPHVDTFLNASKPIKLPITLSNLL